VQTLINPQIQLHRGKQVLWVESKGIQGPGVSQLQLLGLAQKLSPLF
jgi:hypothetical protein